MRGISGTLAIVVMFAILIAVMYFAGGFNSLFSITGDRLGGLEGVNFATLAENVKYTASAGCASLPRYWALMLESDPNNPSVADDQMSRGIDASRSTFKMYVTNPEPRSSVVRVGVPQISGEENLRGRRGFLVAPDPWGSGMWDGMLDPPGNPNEGMRCNVEYDIWLKSSSVSPPATSCPTFDTGNCVYGAETDSGGCFVKCREPPATGRNASQPAPMPSEPLPDMAVIAVVILLIIMLIAVYLYVR